MKLIYIAGPYGAEHGCDIHNNIHTAWGISVCVLKMCPGCFPVVPHLNTMHMDGAVSREEFLAGTLEMMRRCDAVLMIPGWHESRGACKERNVATAMHKPVYYSITEVPEYDNSPA